VTQTKTKMVIYWHPKTGPVSISEDGRKTHTNLESLLDVIEAWFEFHQERRPILGIALQEGARKGRLDRKYK